MPQAGGTVRRIGIFRFGSTSNRLPIACAFCRFCCRWPANKTRLGEAVCLPDASISNPSESEAWPDLPTLAFFVLPTLADAAR